MNRNDEALKNIAVINNVFDKTSFSFQRIGIVLVIFSLILAINNICRAVFSAMFLRYNNPAFNRMSSITGTVFMLLLVILFFIFRFHFLKSYEVFARKLLYIWGIGLILLFVSLFGIGSQNQLYENSGIFVGKIRVICAAGLVLLLVISTLIVTNIKSLIVPALISLAWIVVPFLPFGGEYQVSLNKWPEFPFYIKVICDPIWIVMFTVGMCLIYKKESCEGNERTDAD